MRVVFGAALYHAGLNWFAKQTQVQRAPVYTVPLPPHFMFDGVPALRASKKATDWGSQREKNQGLQL